MNERTKLENENILKLLLIYSIPSIIGMLVNAVYNIIDSIFIGNHPNLDSLGLASISITFPIVIIMMAFSLLFGVGGSILFSTRQGQGELDSAKKILGNVVCILFVTALIETILGLTFLKPMLFLFGADSDTYPFAKEYMTIILIGAVFQNLSMGMNNILRADGKPNLSMGTMLIGAIVNIILDYIFINIFNWGMKGAALATITGQFCSSIWVLSYFFGSKANTRLSLKSLNLDLRLTLQIVKYGLSACLLQVASCILAIVLNRSLFKYGEMSEYGSTIALSGIGIINRLSTLLVLPVLGITQGAQPIWAYNFGAKNIDRVIKTYKYAVIISTIFFCLGFICINLFSTQMISIFTDNELLIEFSADALKKWFLFIPIIGFQIVTANYFQSLGKVKTAIFLSLSRQILFLIPAIIVLGALFGLNGVIYATPFSDALACLVTFVFIFAEVSKYKKMATPN